MQPDQPTTLLAMPLPRFRQPRPPDPALPETETETDDRLSDQPGQDPSSLHPESSPDERPLPPLDPRPDRHTRTGTSSRPGDPKVARQVFAGLIALVCGIAFTALGRRGLWFRQPTEPQIDDVAIPLGRIMARHLPTEMISDDLLDGTAAAAGVHRYFLAGPIVARIQEPLPEDLQ